MTICSGHIRSVYLFLAGAFLPLLAYAQPIVNPTFEVGHPVLRSYSALDYNAHVQNFAVAQSAEGLMYVANGDGILEYDGASWRIIDVPSEGKMQAAVVSDSGIVFMGGKLDLGYLAPDASGQVEFVSLRSHLTEAQGYAFDIRHAHATPAGIFFNAKSHLFRWDGARLHVWNPETPFTGSAQVDGRLLVGGAEGVLEVRGDALHLLPGTELLGGTFEFGLRYDDDRLLLGTKERLMLYDGQTLIPFLDAASLKIPSTITALIRLEDGSFVLGTRSSGLFQVDSEGQLVRIVDATVGLYTDDISHLFIDRDQRLWVSLENGLAWLDLLSPVSSFGSSAGLQGQIEVVTRHAGYLYVGTSTGVYRLEPSGAQHHTAHFRLVEGQVVDTYAFVSLGDRLLALTTSRLYEINGLQATPIADIGGYALSGMAGDPNRVLIGGPDGLWSVRYDPQQQRWGALEQIASFRGGVREIVRGTADEYWLVLLPSGLSRVTFTGDTNESPRMEHFGPEHDLPPGELCLISLPQGVLIASSDGLTHFDEATQRFVLDGTLGTEIAQGDNVLVDPIVTANGIWSSIETDGSNATLHVERFYEKEGGGYQVDVLAPLRQLPISVAWDFYTDGTSADAVSWIAMPGGLYRYDPPRVRLREQPTPVLRSVTLGDSLLYAGQLPPGHTLLTLEANHESVRFSYAFPFFDAPEQTRYQVHLDGFDEAWSVWTEETRKDYTNLPGGSYDFKIRARDSYGRITKEASFPFSVLLPWHQSWWAYLLYLLTGIGFIVGMFQWRVARLNARALYLERIVDERTAQLAQQTDRLQELDIAKSRFFANISHELRTPLTLMVGPLSQLYDEAGSTQPPAVREQLGMMLRNGQRLQRLINQILDLTKLEAGGLRLDCQPHDLVTFARRHVHLYEGLAQYQGVTLSFHATAQAGIVSFDTGQLEKVLANLLSNALKFTDEGGRVSVTVEVQPEAATIRVEDTGVGIPAEKLEHVFDRFYQVEDSSTRTYEGTGIGLSLVKELVELHGGTVHATSELGAGSTFVLHLPREAPVEKRNEQLPKPGAVAIQDRRSAASVGDGQDEALELTNPHLAIPAVAGQTLTVRSNPDAASDQTTILIVEDNADMRSFVRSILEPVYRVLEAADGEEGLHLAQSALPDLILADVMMPKMDGLAMSRALQDDPETNAIPVILLTARAALEDRVEGLETGAGAYLVKPFDAAVLRLQVGNLIGQQQRLRERLLQQPASDPPLPVPPSVFEARVCEIIESHLTDPQFSVEMLADAVALSRQQLYRRLKDDTGATPVAFIRTYRLERAAQLLRVREGNVSEVAYAVGFNSLSYFARSFREHFEATPSDYQLREAG